MGISILIVCNDQYTLDTLNKDLAGSGYNIHLENDIRRAAEVSEEREIFDVGLLCILHSNVKSMIILLELMKNKRPDIKCIMLSTMNNAEIVSECLMKGAATVLTGPLNREKIIAAISDVVQSHTEKNDLMKILILEDDPVSGKMLANYLESYGKCDLTTDGKSAVALFQNALQSEDRYRLIFIDIMVPEILGHDVLKIIRETEQKKRIPIGKKAKIIMTTSLSDPENIIEAFKETCDSYLIKPIRKDKLINDIKSLGLLRDFD